MTHYVGTRDVTMVHSVVDISLNRITRPIFAAAAGAVCGMARALPVERDTTKPLVAASMYSELCGGALYLEIPDHFKLLGGASHRELHEICKKIPFLALLPSKTTVNKGFSPFWGAMIPSPSGPTPLAALHHP